ncbi:hypothetical protein IIA16_03540 [bacterium]|nr:hypothetical protein [bacterium]
MSKYLSLTKHHLMAASLLVLAGCGAAAGAFIDTQFSLCVPSGTGTSNVFPARGQDVGSDAVSVYVTEPLSDHYPINCLQASDPFLLVAGMQALFPARVLSIYNPAKVIDAATISVRIAVPDIKSRTDVVAALLAALGRGVIVEIVVEDFYRNNNLAVYNALQVAGATIKTDANDLNLRVNSNYMVIDSDEVFFSSGNFLSNGFFTTSNLTVRIKDIVVAACFLGDFNQMVTENRFQGNKLDTAAKCEGLIVDGKYGVDIYFGPHNNQIRDEIGILFAQTSFSLNWGNSALSELTVAGGLAALADRGVVVQGVVNGADQGGGTFLSTQQIYCFSDPNTCSHTDLPGQSGVGIDQIGLGIFGLRGQNLRYFVGDAQSNLFSPYFAITSANLSSGGLTRNDEVMVVLRDLELARFGAFTMHARAMLGVQLVDETLTVQEPALAFVRGTVALKNDASPLGDNLPDAVTVTLTTAGLATSTTVVELSGGAGSLPFSAFLPVGGVVTIAITADGYKPIVVTGVLVGPGSWDLGHFRPQITNGFQSGDGGGA